MLTTRRTVALALALALLVAVGGTAPASAREQRPSVASGAPTPCPAEEGTPRFLRFVYLQILNRCPDPAGAAHWTARLDAGLDRWRFAEAIDVSTENLVRNNVDRWYQGILGRPPTSAERQRWVAHVRANHENAVPIATLLASDEWYRTRAGSGTPAERDGRFLDEAYARILDRAPDPGGRAFFLRRFGPGGSTERGRFEVAMVMERSDANANSWVRASMAGALGRPGDPAGVAHWTRWLTGPGRWQTFRMWTRHLSSNEAYRYAQTQPDLGPSWD